MTSLLNKSLKIWHFILFLVLYSGIVIYVLRPDFFVKQPYIKASMCVDERAGDYLVDNFFLTEDKDNLVQMAVNFALEQCEQYIDKYAQKVHDLKYSDSDKPDSNVSDIKSDVKNDLKSYYTKIYNKHIDQANKALERNR